jgi:hypothetical protein
MTTERERQAAANDGPYGGCDWIVYPARAFAGTVLPVECRAGTERGALRVAEAEHPGVVFLSAVPGRLRKR